MGPLGPNLRLKVLQFGTQWRGLDVAQEVVGVVVVVVVVRVGVVGVVW